MIPALLGLGLSLVGSNLLSQLQTSRITVLHAIPGRIRLHCREWNNEKLATAIADNLLTHSCVQRIHVSPLTKTMVIEFEKKHIRQDELDEILSLAMKESKESYKRSDSKVSRVLKGSISTVNENMKIQTRGFLDVHSLLIPLLIFQGLRIAHKNKPFAASLLFWAYSMLNYQK